MKKNLTKKNPGCKKCKYFFKEIDFYLIKSPTYICSHKENTIKIEEWDQDQWENISSPKDLNKNRDCPNFECAIQKEDPKEELTSFWSPVKRCFKRIFN